MADFSDLGGTQVASSGPSPDFSDLGGKPVEQDEGALAASGRGFLRNFPLAQQAAAAIAPINPLSEKSNYSDELQHLTHAAEASKSAHPVAYGAGAVAGTAAPLLIPGAGEALEAAPVMGNAALNIAQSQSDTNLTKPTLGNAKEAALAGIIGGGLGKIGQGLKAVAPTAEEAAAASTAKGLGATARRLNPIMGKNPEANLTKLGNWMNTATDSEGNALVNMADRPGAILKKVQSAHDAAGETIGDIIDQVAPDMTVPKRSIINELKPIASDLDIIDPASKAKVVNLIDKIKDLDKSGRLNFDTLHNLKGLAWKAAEKDSNVMPAYGVISDYVNSVVDEYGRNLADPAVKASYDAAKVNYHNSSQLLKILRFSEARELSKGPIGNAGLGGIASLIGGVATGHPIAGVGGAIGASLGRPIADMLGRNAALKVVPYMPAIATGARGLNKAAQLELANALQAKYGAKNEP